MSIRKTINKIDIQKQVKTLSPITKGLDLISEHVIITDIDGNILYANEAVEKNTGFSRKEILGKNPGDLWGGKMPKEFYDKMWHIIKKEKKLFVGDVNNVRKNGGSYWQELHISPILDHNNDVRFFLGIEPNITDRKSKEQFREEFISIIGHQLRNPLASIQLILELLIGSGTLKENDRKKLQAAYFQNKDLSGFVADLLLLSSPEKIRLNANFELVELSAEIKKIIEEVKIRNSSVKFVFSVDDKFPLKVSKSFAIQVFSNLIYNAAEYSDKIAGEVEINLKKSDNAYTFSCYNNGPAINEEDKSHIFTKLFRSADAIKIKKSGTGLGLFIVKMIADNLDWKVWFESSPGHGTTFYVKILINK